MVREGKRKIKKTAASALAFGILMATVSFFVCALISAIILNMTEDPLGNLGVGSLFSLILSGIITGFSTAKYKGEGGIAPTVLATLCFAIILLIIGLALSGGNLPAVITVNLMLYVAASFVSALIASKKRNQKSRRKHK